MLLVLALVLVGGSDLGGPVPLHSQHPITNADHSLQHIGSVALRILRGLNLEVQSHHTR